MTVNREMRASDQDREHVVEVLRTHYTEGRLNLEEFDERVARAYESKTLGDLLDLTTDLPGGVSLGPVQPPAVAEPQSGPPSRLPRQFLPIAVALVGLVLVSSVIWSGIANQGHHHFVVIFPWPLLLLLFFFSRRGGGRSYRNGPGAR
jgi:DUF1707 SHOCT-like domain